MTTQAETSELIDTLETVFPPATDEDNRRLAGTLFQLLAEGEPVGTALLAEALGRSEAEIAANLTEPTFESLIYRDDRGRVVAFGGMAVADLAKTPHRLRLGDRELYPWCAADALFLPFALGREARIESICPTTEERITLSASPEGFGDLDPSGAVMSFLDPGEIEARAADQGFDVIRSFCHFVHFFASDEAARAWMSRHPGTIRISVDDGFELGRRWVSHTFGLGSER